MSRRSIYQLGRDWLIALAMVFLVAVFILKVYEFFAFLIDLVYDFFTYAIDLFT
jgi:hypothetical protein